MDKITFAHDSTIDGISDLMMDSSYYLINYVRIAMFIFLHTAGSP